LRPVSRCERFSLRPVRAIVEMRSADRSLDLEVVLRTSRWNDPAIVTEVQDGGS